MLHLQKESITSPSTNPFLVPSFPRCCSRGFKAADTLSLIRARSKQEDQNSEEKVTYHSVFLLFVGERWKDDGGLMEDVVFEVEVFLIWSVLIYAW